MPNTHVRWRPALWGALVAAVLTGATKWAFGLYVSQALPYMKLYGAIGLVPLFLFWLYLNWLLVLFGLEIAYTLQAMKGRVFEYREGRGALATADPQWLIPLMVVLARRGLDGRPVSRQDLAEDLELRLEAVNELLGRLEAEGLVLQVSREGDDIGLFSSGNPTRAAGPIVDTWPVLNDLLGAPPADVRFIGQVVRNNLTPSATLTGTSRRKSKLPT